MQTLPKEKDIAVNWQSSKWAKSQEDPEWGKVFTMRSAGKESQHATIAGMPNAEVWIISNLEWLLTHGPTQCFDFTEFFLFPVS